MECDADEGQFLGRCRRHRSFHRSDAVGIKVSPGDRVNDEIDTPVGVEVSTGGCVVNKVGAPDGVEVSTGDCVVKKEGASDVMVLGWSPGASVCPSVVGVCVVRD